MFHKHTFFFTKTDDVVTTDTDCTYDSRQGTTELDNVGCGEDQQRIYTDGLDVQSDIARSVFQNF